MRVSMSFMDDTRLAYVSACDVDQEHLQIHSRTPGTNLLVSSVYYHSTFLRDPDDLVNQATKVP